jgi:hypothetical protein
MRGQSATEYLILISIAILVGLAAISILGYGGVSETKKISSDIYWTSARPISIPGAQVTPDGTLTVIANNKESELVEISALEIGGVQMAVSPVVKISPGGSQALSIQPGGTPFSSSGACTFNGVCFHYAMGELGGLVQCGSQEMVIECPNSCTGECGLLPNGGNCTSGLQCLSGICSGGFCSCAPIDADCPAGGAQYCCTGYCEAGACALRPIGSGCSSDDECGTGICDSGGCVTCRTNSTCTNTTECCIGYCDLGACTCRPSQANCDYTKPYECCLGKCNWNYAKCCIDLKETGCIQTPDCCRSNDICSNGKCCFPTGLDTNGGCFPNDPEGPFAQCCDPLARCTELPGLDKCCRPSGTTCSGNERNCCTGQCNAQGNCS